MPSFEHAAFGFARTAPPKVAEWWKEKARCRGCGARLTASVPYEVRDASIFHPSCAARFDALQMRATPRIIGRLIGVAVPFNQQCYIGPGNASGDRSERFLMGCFSASIARGAVQLKRDHQAVIDGLLALYETRDALLFRAHLFDTPIGVHTLERVRRGDAKGCSIGFRSQPNGERSDGRVTTVSAADLKEISVCIEGQPAWYGTVVRVES